LWGVLCGACPRVLLLLLLLLLRHMPHEGCSRGCTPGALLLPLCLLFFFFLHTTSGHEGFTPALTNYAAWAPDAEVRQSGSMCVPLKPKPSEAA
jgi:hypothetical protein